MTSVAAATTTTTKDVVKTVDSKEETKDDNRVIILSFPSQAKLAKALCDSSPEHFRLGNVQWGYFPDGWLNISFEKMEKLENRDVVFIGSLYDRTKFVEQLSLAMVLPRQFVKSLNLVFPYFAPATMERVEEEGVLASAETVARIISSCIPMTRSGPSAFRVFDIHALPVRFYFEDNVCMRMMSAVSLLWANMPKGATIAFPDEGASKRFRKVIPSTVPVIICAKVRDGEKRIISITDRMNWPKDDKACYDNVIIMDDLVQTGGTLNECRLALQKQGAKKVSAYCTHAVFPNKGYEKFMKGGDYEGFDTFYLTDTCPEVSSIIEDKAPFKILSIKDILLADLKKQLSLK